MPSQYVLAFDIASGGISAARFDEKLEASGFEEFPWEMPLTVERVALAFQTLTHAVQRDDTAAAIAISSFMHSFLLLAPTSARPVPVYTWMDFAPSKGIDAIRSAIGPGFHERTGCHYHPMFPVFKIASMKVEPWSLVASPKSLLVSQITGRFAEDYGMASSSGLLNIHSGRWDDEILQALNLVSPVLPELQEPHAIVGKANGGVSNRLGIHPDSIVVNGSGDGFLANIGSGCESSNRIAITVGTSAAVRRMVSAPILDPRIGTFCYRADSQDSFLLGCASNNGGNALDWARHQFGVSTSEGIPKRDIPIFLPWLKGERSLEWNSELQPVWDGRRSDHTPEELFRSVMEGVLFNIAQYVEVIEESSGSRASQIVLSGNGFLDPAVAPVLAALVSRETLQPESSGLGTLRGTAVCAWRALGHDATPAVEGLLHCAPRVNPIPDSGLAERFIRFKELRRKTNPLGASG